ncbi:MAG: DUF2256 domain-containing protein [Methylocystaceae bacterium]|nr:DUF2256 domain-containing protein [Methylocystaceae bacterium]
MARMRQKSDLPKKTCLVCGRTFSWRKKWARDWVNVKYCSNACRNALGKPVTGQKEDTT